VRSTSMLPYTAMGLSLVWTTSAHQIGRSSSTSRKLLASRRASIRAKRHVSTNGYGTGSAGKVRCCLPSYCAMCLPLASPMTSFNVRGAGLVRERRSRGAVWFTVLDDVAELRLCGVDDEAQGRISVTPQDRKTG
jgi:hypothetical protein